MAVSGYKQATYSEYHPSISAITFVSPEAQRFFTENYVPELKGIEPRPLVEPKPRQKVMA